MILPGVTLTPALAAWIRAAHDDGAADLVVDVEFCTGCPRNDHPAGYSCEGRDVRHEVLRADGTELSPTEQTEVRALLAAHAVEPLRMPTK